MPGPSILTSVSEASTEEEKEWITFQGSKPIANTFGRLDSIEVGDGSIEEKQPDQTDRAYAYNQRLKRFLETQGVSKPQEVANALMLRIAGDIAFTRHFASFPGICAGPEGMPPWSVQEAFGLSVEPGRPSIRFRVENGKCIIEKAFLEERKFTDGETPRDLAWVTTRIEIDPNNIGDQWTEHVTTKPYAQALAEEVVRRQEKGTANALEEVKAEMQKQITNSSEREKLIKDMTEAYEKKRLRTSI